MNPSKDVVELIKEFEGFRAQSYSDVVGVWTIGYGTTRVHGNKVVPGMVCTREEAEEYLYDELEPVAERISAMVKVPLTQNQFDALCSFSYNLGTGALQSSTLLRKLNAGDYNGSANEFPKWDHAGGKKVAGLTRRREAERNLFTKQ